MRYIEKSPSHIGEEKKWIDDAEGGGGVLFKKVGAIFTARYTAKLDVLLANRRSLTPPTDELIFHPSFTHFSRMRV